jgi:hypothetical protein
MTEPSTPQRGRPPSNRRLFDGALIFVNSIRFLVGKKLLIGVPS